MRAGGVTPSRDADYHHAMSHAGLSAFRDAWQSRGGRVLRYVVALALLALAVGFAARGVDPAALGRAAWWQWAIIAGGVGVNLAATTAMFQWTTRLFHPEPPVRWATMARLIAASTLLNYVPLLRLGLWSRAAYLKRHHGVSITDTAKGLGVVLAVSLAVVASAAGVLVAAGRLGWPAWGAWAGLVGVAAGLGVGCVLVARYRPLGRFQHRAITASRQAAAERSEAGDQTAGTCRTIPGFAPLSRGFRRFVAADARGSQQPRGAGGDARPGWWAAARVVDVAASGVRLWAALSVVGVDVAVHEAVLLGCASVLGRLAAVTPNGLGVSEWLVALVGASRAWADPVSASLLAAAAVIDRGVEVAVMVPAGMAGVGEWRGTRGASRHP